MAEPKEHDGMTTAKRPFRRIACIGEVMIEVASRPDGTAKVGVAGDTFNTAVYLARALRGTGASVAYVTALGRDRYSERILSALDQHRLDTSLIERRDDLMPGLYAIDTDEHGERSFSYWRSVSAARTLFSEPCAVALSDLAKFDLLLLSGISLAILPDPVREKIFTFLDAFRAQGGSVAYDSNHRPRLWETVGDARRVNTEMWRRADIALPSVDDEMTLFDDTSEESVRARLNDLGAVNGALKRGAKGPMDLATGDCVSPGTAPVQVVDSTAAGDSFNAGYLAALYRGKPQMDALKAGHDLAAKVIGHSGAIIPEG